MSNIVCRIPSKTVTAMTLHGYAAGRPHGLFPPRDPLLKELAEDPTAHPFEKHLAGERSPYELLKHGSWTSGDEAAQAGFDMRLFYKVSSPSIKIGCFSFISSLASLPLPISSTVIYPFLFGRTAREAESTTLSIQTIDNLAFKVCCGHAVGEGERRAIRLHFGSSTFG